MKICDIYSASEPTVATIGFFDGVHLGHQFLLKQVRDVAREMGCASMAITFPVHPRKVLQADFQPKLLTTKDEKCERLALTGIDYCLMLDFTRELSALSAREFMQMLKEQCHVRALVIGYDHRFGHNRSEGYDDYCRYGDEMGLKVVRAVPYSLPDGRNVSSSLIRSLLAEGNVAEAYRCLGYRYMIDGTVVGGFHIGRTLGFPTANIRLADSDKLLPADGVYAVKVSVGGDEHDGMLNIGTRPTIGNGDGSLSIEVHIFGFHKDIYSQVVRVTFVQRTRGEIKFGSRDELSQQLTRDAEQIKKLLER